MLTQEGLSELVNVAPATVSKWENAHVMPNEDIFPKLCTILDKTEKYFFNHDTDKNVVAELKPMGQTIDIKTFEKLCHWGRNPDQVSSETVMRQMAVILQALTDQIQSRDQQIEELKNEINKIKLLSPTKTGDIAQDIIEGLNRADENTINAIRSILRVAQARTEKTVVNNS